MTEWDEVTIGEVTENYDSKRIPVRSRDRKPGPYPYYGASGIVDWVDGYLFEGLYLLVAEDGENVRARKTPIAFLADGRFWVNNHAHIIRGNARADTRFLSYAIEASDISGYITGSAQPKLSQSSMNAIRLRLPPLHEQRAIASVLGSLDDKIELNRRMNRTLEQMAAAIFKAWFVDFEPVRAKASGATSFPGMPQPVFDALPATFADSELGPIPEGWEVKPIGDAVQIKGGGTPSTKNPEFWDGPHHWVTPKDLSGLSDPILLDTSRRLTDAGVAKVSSGLLPVGTVLLSSRAPIGYLAISAIETAVNQGFIAMLPGGALSPSYLLNWASYYMDEIKGNANGTTFQEISKKNFRPLRVVIPSPEVAAGFQSLVGPLYDQVRLNMRESTTLAETRDALLPKLLSGEVRVEQMAGVA